LLLVIDDDPDCLEVFRCQLEALGVRVVVASDGVSGLNQLELWRPDAVLCDLAMPGMDGFEFGFRVRGDTRFRRMPLIAVTGLSEQTSLMASWGAGFDGHITKPVLAETLAGILQRFLGHRLRQQAARRSA
jgi:CheY-like chemotaxis protein